MTFDFFFFSSLFSGIFGLCGVNEGPPAIIRMTTVIPTCNVFEYNILRLSFPSIRLSLRTEFGKSMFCAGYCSISSQAKVRETLMRNRRKLSFIRIGKLLNAGVAKNPVSESMNGFFLNNQLIDITQIL